MLPLLMSCEKLVMRSSRWTTNSSSQGLRVETVALVVREANRGQGLE